MFITFEGIDGAGKSAVASALLGVLEGYNIFITSEPTHTPLGNIIRERILTGSSPVETAFLFLADRASHQQEIQNHLRNGEIVLCDRYHDSTIAYQGVALEEIMGKKHALEFLERMWQFYAKPDATLLFLLEPEEAIHRIAHRAQKTSYEKIEFLEKVQKVFILLAEKEPRRFITVDSSVSLKNLIDDVADKVKTIISRRQL